MAKVGTSIHDSSLAYLPADIGGTALFETVVRFSKLLSECGIRTLNLGDLRENGRFELAHRIGPLIPNLSIHCECPLNRQLISHMREALKTSSSPRLGLRVLTAPETIRKAPWQSYSALTLLMEDCIHFGVRLGFSVNILMEEASTTEPVFAARLALQAVRAGASTITLCESGNISPEAFAHMVYRVTQAIPGTPVAIRCSNRMGLAAATCLTSLESGATEIITVASKWIPQNLCPSLDELADTALFPIPAAQLTYLSAQAELLQGLASKAQFEAAAGEL